MRATCKPELDAALERLRVLVVDEERPPAPCRCGEPTAVGLELCEACEVIERQRRAGFYAEFEGARLSDFPVTIATVAAKLLEPRRAVRGLLVNGWTGSGKTRLLAALASEMPGAVFGLARSLIRATWDVERQEQEIRRLSCCSLLLLDDLGREGKASEAVLSVVHEILSARNGNFLPTAISSNLTLEQIAQRYDEAIADRLVPWGRVVMAGRSRRRRPA